MKKCFRARTKHYKPVKKGYRVKAIPHKDCAKDTQSDFLSDCIKITQTG